MSKVNRRSFLRHTMYGALGAVGMSTFGNWAQAAALTPQSSDYRALVCLFLFGGNDGDNTVIPRSQAEHNKYATIRGALTVPRSNVLPINPINSLGGLELGLHPALPELQQLFEQGRVAVLLNTGPLVRPTTKADYIARRSLPLGLFGHLEQQLAFMTARPTATMQGTGWGGRLADRVNYLNPNPQVSMAITTSGSNNFQAADQVFQYPLSASGVAPAYQGVTYGGSDAASQVFTALVNQPQAGVFEDEYGKIQQRSINAEIAVRTALQNVTLTTPFPATGLGNQMRTVARLIAARQALGVRRQVFFCALGGFDTHGDQASGHPPLLQQVSQAMAAFYNATVELGVANNVTTFTLSDFGRNKFNGRGTDHGWGSHFFIMGGAVNGRRVYGVFPDQQLGSNDDTGNGSWIPTTATDQYAATLATWFGLPAAQLPEVFPNIGNFNQVNLGFMSS